MERLEALNSMGWAIDVRIRPPGICAERYVIEATRFDGQTLARYSATGRTSEQAELRLLVAMRVGAGVETQAADVLEASA